MRKMIIYAMLLPLLAAALNANAQDVEKELEKVARAYINAEHLSMDVNVHVYTDKNDKTGRLLGKGMMRRSKNNYYSKFLNEEMVMNKHCAVVIDHGEKTIDYFGSLEAPGKKQGLPMPDVKAIIAASDSVKYMGTENGKKHFVIISRKAMIVRTDMYVDAASNFIVKLVYHYNQDMDDDLIDVYKAVIDYTAISQKPVSDEVFSEKKFVTLKTGKPVPATAYSNYQLTAAEKPEL